MRSIRNVAFVALVASAMACGSQVVEFPLDETTFGNPPPVDVDAGDSDAGDDGGFTDIGSPPDPWDGDKDGGTSSDSGQDSTVPPTDAGPGKDSGGNVDGGTGNDSGSATDGGGGNDGGASTDGGSCNCSHDSGPPVCVPKTKRQACGALRCVKVENGCGGKIFCGDERACNACNYEYKCCGERCEARNECEDDTKRCKRKCGEDLVCCYAAVSL